MNNPHANYIQMGTLRMDFCSLQLQLGMWKVLMFLFVSYPICLFEYSRDDLCLDLLCTKTE